LQTKKQIDESKAGYNKSLAQYDSIKDSVYFNVKKAYLDLQTDKESIIIAKLALDQAKEQYRQVTGRYKAGVGDAIELKDGENTYLNARLDFYNAILNYNISFANLEKEIGVPIKFSDDLIIKISPSEL
jgi:outer membrane protein TolC